MFNLPSIMILLYVSIFMVGVPLLVRAFPHRKRTEVRWLMLMTVCTCIVAFSSLNVYIWHDLEKKVEFSRLRFLGYAVLGQVWFFFITSTYSREKIRRILHHPIFIAISMAPGIVSILMTVVPAWHEYFTRDYRIFAWNGVQLLEFSHGPWFPVAVGVSNIFALGTIIYSLWLLPKLSGVKKNQLMILTIGGAISTVINYYCVNLNPTLRWAMFPGGVFFVTQASIFYAMIRHGLLDLSPIAKNQFFKDIPDPVIILDEQSQITEFNESAKNFFHLTPRNIHRPMQSCSVLSAVDLGKDSQEFRFSSEKDGIHFFQIEIKSMNQERYMAGKIVLFREITAQKELEAKLSGNLEFKARLLSIIAHDFSGILQAQSMISSNLQKEVQPNLKERAALLADSTYASKDLMANILLWARTQENKFQPVVRPFEINTLLREVVESLQSIWKLRNLKINIQSDKTPLILQGDGVMIESVVRNLLSNAIQASMPGQSVELSIATSAHNVKIGVKDFGIGMTQKQLEAIHASSLEAFSNPDRRPSGFGIGLAVVRRFIDLHHGKLEFASEEGKGTSVTLTLPL